VSHISSYATELRLNPVAGPREAETDQSRRLFRAALESVAEEYGGHVTNYIHDYFARRRQVDFALITPQFSAGVGVEVSHETGQVKFVYDDYGVAESLVTALKDRIIQTYTTMAVAHALESMNYQVECREETRQHGRRQVLVRGVL